MNRSIKLKDGKKVYFASDFHLGAPDHLSSLAREKKIIAWLDEIKKDAQLIFLMGDLFDFWFEYKSVVPKGFVRFLGKIAELSDAGIEIKIFTGNHDMWMTDYFQKELGAEVFFDTVQYQIGEKAFFLGHGDGLGPGDHGYKFLKKVFKNRVARFLFGRVMHPNLGQFLGNTWSLNSWKKNRANDTVKAFENGDKELLYSYCKQLQAEGKLFDYYIFGHRHCKLDLPLEHGARYINIGDWIVFDSYAVFDGKQLELKVFNKLTAI